MASIKFGGGVSEIRGSIGGTVFSRNKNGAYTRQRTKNINRNTAKQQIARAAFGAVAQLWRGLTTLQRQSWQEQTPNYPYVNRLGEQSTYTARQLFQKLNSQLVGAGLPTISTCLTPQAFFPLNPRLELLRWDEGVPGGFLNAPYEDESIVVIPTGFRVVWEMTRKLSAGVTAPKDSDFVQLITRPAGDATSLPISDPVIELLGSAPKVGDTIFVRAFQVNIATGQRTQAYAQEVIIENT